MVTFFERSMTTTVNDIEHIESQSYTGVSVTRVYFQPNAKVELALAQITAISQTLLRPMPPGTLPPSIIKYDASSVPILQLGLQSDTMSEQELFDMGQNFIRTQLATIQGASVPLPYGGKFRQVMVDLNPDQLTSKGLSASDVSSALGNQNLIFPAGTAKIGDKDYQVRTNSSPRDMAELNIMPLRVVNGATVYLKDVAQVRDGYSVQTSIVRTNGRRGALLTVLRNGKASTLAVVNNVKAALPKILAGLPSALQVKQLFDQSLFVRAAINGVVREGVIAADPHRPHDPAVPRKLAQHRDCLHLHPAVDSDVADHPEPARPDDQRDDARRPRARRRHPGGRRHRRNRKHASQHGHAQTAGARRTRRRRSRLPRRPSSPPWPSASSSSRCCC